MEELFEAALPSYLAIGMSSEEFWHGELWLCKAYREAYEIQRDNKYMAEWRQGMYFLEALRAAAPAYREISKGEQHPYPEHPLFSVEQDKQKAQEDKEKAQMERNKALFEAFAASFNAKMDSEEKGD